MFPQTIGKVAVVPLTSGAAEYISVCEVQVQDIDGSMTPQLRVFPEGTQGTPPTYLNCPYTDKLSGTSYAAGTAITTDSIYEFDVSGCQLAMNVTVVTNPWTVYVKPLIGSTNGAGGAQAITIADGDDVALGSVDDDAYDDPTGAADGTAIALLKGIYVNTATP